MSVEIGVCLQLKVCFCFLNNIFNPRINQKHCHDIFRTAQPNYASLHECTKKGAFANCTNCTVDGICLLPVRYPDSCWCRLKLHHVLLCGWECVFVCILTPCRGSTVVWFSPVCRCLEKKLSGTGVSFS